MLSCRLASGPLWLGIYPFLWWFLLVIFVLFLLHWRYELPCQDKLPEFHCTPILGCIRVLWLVFHPLGLRLDKALCGWNSVTSYEFNDNRNLHITDCNFKLINSITIYSVSINSITINSITINSITINSISINSIFNLKKFTSMIANHCRCLKHSQFDWSFKL